VDDHKVKTIMDDQKIVIPFCPITRLSVGNAQPRKMRLSAGINLDCPLGFFGMPFWIFYL